MSIWSTLLDISDRAARKLGQTFLRNPADSANMGDATTPVRIDPTGTTAQPVTDNAGSLTVDQATATNLKAEVVGPTADNAANPAAKQAVLAGVANAAAPTRTEGNVNPLRLNLAGDVAITLDGEAVVLGAGAATIGSLAANQSVNVAQYGGAATTLGTKVAASSVPVVPASDWVDQDTVGAATALNALNAAASVAVAGRNGAGFFLAAGTLIGTIVPEVSLDGGTTWVAGYFFDPVAQNTSSSVVFTVANAAKSLSLLTPPGTTSARVRVSAFTSGTATGTLRATQAMGTETPIFQKPFPALGFYRVAAGTGVYSGLAAGAALFSMRWGDATRLAVIQRVTVAVIQSVPATTAGRADRELVVARAFTVSDSGGTAIVLTGDNAKMRTSMPTSLVTDMRIATTAALTAGTRTLDTQGIGIQETWLDLSTAATAVAAASTPPATTIIPKGDLCNAMDAGVYPLVLAQNEGIIIRMPTAQPAGSSLSSFVEVWWAEVNAY